MDDQKPLPVLRGRSVFLRPPERDDIDRFVRWFSDADMLRFIGMRAPMSRALEERWFEHMLESQGKEVFHFVICLREEGRPIGTIGFFDINLLNGSAEVGISIGEKSLWGKGLGTDAMEALVDFGFGELRLERIKLRVYAYNARARRSSEKVGFTLEGTERRAKFRRGEYHDDHIMSILRDEWQAQERPRSWDLPWG
jgi:RimJ/RimL family protein N-acetyltransferase